MGLMFLRDLEQGKKSLRMDKVNQVLQLFGARLGGQEFIQLGTSYDLNETQIRNAFGNILDREKSCRISLKGVF